MASSQCPQLWAVVMDFSESSEEDSVSSLLVWKLVLISAGRQYQRLRFFRRGCLASWSSLVSGVLVRLFSSDESKLVVVLKVDVEFEDAMVDFGWN